MTSMSAEAISQQLQQLRLFSQDIQGLRGRRARSYTAVAKLRDQCARLDVSIAALEAKLNASDAECCGMANLADEAKADDLMYRIHGKMTGVTQAYRDLHAALQAMERVGELVSASLAPLQTATAVATAAIQTHNAGPA